MALKEASMVWRRAGAVDPDEVRKISPKQIRGISKVLYEVTPDNVMEVLLSSDQWIEKGVPVVLYVPPLDYEPIWDDDCLPLAGIRPRSCYYYYDGKWLPSEGLQSHLQSLFEYGQDVVVVLDHSDLESCN